jgi:hypothetical protein
MLKCEVCGAKEGAPVRLPAGDTVPRQLFRCPSCKTVLCNGCLRQESVIKKQASRNPLRLFAGLVLGANASGFVQMQCSICSTVVDLETDRLAAGLV